MNPNLQNIKQRFGIIGNAPALDNALSTAITVAPTDLSVLIIGESGTGKEVFSRIIHSLSNRKHNPFIAINCGAIPEGTINSELFGHTKGAFTGATGDRKGYFETVNSGTIFMDEIGEMPLETQTRLLRVLEQGEYIRVGDSQVQKTNVRIVAATNVKLMEAIKKGRFREDLYYRLSTVPINVPPLRERKEDITLLFRKFAQDFAEKYNTTSVRLDPEAQITFESYQFPGNVRELRNLTEQISLLSPSKVLNVNLLHNFLPKIENNSLALVPSSGSAESSTNNFQEREIIFKFLYDMKRDISELKKLVIDLVETNNLSIPRGNKLLNEIIYSNVENGFVPPPSTFQADHQSSSLVHSINNTPTPFTINHQPIQETEDQLSLEDIEKDYILKALSKHKGRRRDAAAELGISERTLYRKIKEYQIKE